MILALDIGLMLYGSDVLAVREHVVVVSLAHEDDRALAFQVERAERLVARLRQALAA